MNEIKPPSAEKVTSKLKATAALRKNSPLTPSRISNRLRRTAQLRKLAYTLPKHDKKNPVD